MLSMKFKEFMLGKYDDESEFYKIYIVRNKDEVLYVGISRDNIYNRWFSRFSGRMYKTGEAWCGLDSIGNEIADHMPDSLEYIIDLYTQNEMVDICKEDIEKIYGSSETMRLSDSLERVEHFAIDKFRPALNVIGNRWQRELHQEEHSKACVSAVYAAFGRIDVDLTDGV